MISYQHEFGTALSPWRNPNLVRAYFTWSYVFGNLPKWGPIDVTGTHRENDVHQFIYVGVMQGGSLWKKRESCVKPLFSCGMRRRMPKRSVGMLSRVHELWRILELCWQHLTSSQLLINVSMTLGCLSLLSNVLIYVFLLQWEAFPYMFIILPVQRTCELLTRTQDNAQSHPNSNPVREAVMEVSTSYTQLFIWLRILVFNMNM